MSSMPFETQLPNSEDGHLGLFYLQFMALFNTTESVLLIFGYDSLLVFWRNWPLCLECRIKRGSGCLWSYDFLPHYHSGRWFGSSEEKIFLKYNPSHFFLDKKSAVEQPRRGCMGSVHSLRKVAGRRIGKRSVHVQICRKAEEAGGQIKGTHLGLLNDPSPPAMEKQLQIQSS